MRRILISLTLATRSMAGSDSPAAASPTAPANEDTIVLLHGLGRTSRSMEWLGRRLADGGFRVVNLGYPSTDHSIERLAAQLRDPIDRESRGAGRIHFVTHSMGGIVLRAHLKDSRPPNLGRIVMLSPPNQGSEVVDRLRGNGWFRRLTGPAGGQLGTDPESVPIRLGAADFEVGIIAGNRSLNPLFSAWIHGPDDGKVSVRRAALDGMQDFLVMPAGHTFIMRQPAVAAQVAWFLRHGRFRPART